jgi:hypothetical protein
MVLHLQFFIKVHPKYFDCSALVFLTMITLCLASKCVILFLKAANQDNYEHGIKIPIIDVINMGTDLSYWVLLNFFIVEMKTVRDIISAKDNKEFESKFALTIKLRKFFLPILALSGFTFRFIVSLKLLGLDFTAPAAQHAYNII